LQSVFESIFDLTFKAVEGTKRPFLYFQVSKVLPLNSFLSTKDTIQKWFFSSFFEKNRFPDEKEILK